jgi:hypothetical protein
LQRAIVDFAADQPFAQARMKLKEHYGVEIGQSTIQRISFAHAEAIFEEGRKGVDFSQEPGSSKPIVVETDGGMVPVVEPSRAATGRTSAKARSCHGGRPSFHWRTRREAGRRSTPVRSKAASKRQGGSC